MLQRTHVPAEARALFAAGRERVFQQRKQRHRRELFGRGARGQRKERARRRARQFFSSRIIDCHVPAGELRGDAAREPAIRRDQRCRPSLGLQGLAQSAGDHHRFLARILRFDQCEAFQRGRDLAPALEGFALIEAQNPREEAMVIACALREALETKGRTAALVTPDRGLARRVAAELTRWDVTIDDSAGEKLSRTPPGAFLALAARAAAEQFAPVPLLALLKHPLAAGGEERIHFRRNVRALEHAALRGLRPDPGLAGIATRLRHVKAPFALQHWFAKLVGLLEPFAQAMAAKDSSLSEL